MKNKQLSHLEFKKVQKVFKSSVILILENLQHWQNIGSAFRLADAFNVEEIIIVNEDDKLEIDKIKKTARSTDKFVKYQIVNSTEKAIKAVSDKNYTTFALEITSDSKPLREYNFSNYSAIALIIGNEKSGVKPQTLLNVENTVHIDMFGNNSSMNVATALAISLYKISEDYFNK